MIEVLLVSLLATSLILGGFQAGKEAQPGRGECVAMREGQTMRLGNGARIEVRTAETPELDGR